MEFWDVFVSYYEEMKGTFTNFSMDDPLTILGLVVGAFVGVLAFIIAAFISKHRTSSIVDAIIAKNAISPETAITPAEGGFARPWQLNMLKKGAMLRKTVSAVDKEGRTVGPYGDIAENGTANEPQTAAPKVNTTAPKKPELPTKAAVLKGVASLRFFIPEEKKRTAISRFSQEKHAVLSLVISVAVSVVIFTALYYFLPQILRLLDNAITMLS